MQAPGEKAAGLKFHFLHLQAVGGKIPHVSICQQQKHAAQYVFRYRQLPEGQQFVPLDYVQFPRAVKTQPAVNHNAAGVFQQHAQQTAPIQGQPLLAFGQYLLVHGKDANLSGRGFYVFQHLLHSLVHNAHRSVQSSDRVFFVPSQIQLHAHGTISLGVPFILPQFSCNKKAAPGRERLFLFVTGRPERRSGG